MRLVYFNFNGELLVENKEVLTVNNRSFRYGDGLFETMLWKEGEIRFLNAHIKRLQNGLEILKINNWEKFNARFLTEKTQELILKNDFQNKTLKVRLQVFRDGSGTYAPQSNEPAYVLEVEPFELDLKTHHTGLILDLYTEQIKPFSGLSALKTSNSLVYILAANYRKNKGVDEVVILNQEGMVCETIQSNLFVLYDNKLYTPALNQGCVAGVMRENIIEIAKNKLGLEVVEAKIDPQVLEVAEEMFITNAIRGVQWVVGYKKRRFFNVLSKKIQKYLD